MVIIFDAGRVSGGGLLIPPMRRTFHFGRVSGVPYTDFSQLQMLKSPAYVSEYGNYARFREAELRDSKIYNVNEKPFHGQGEHGWGQRATAPDSTGDSKRDQDIVQDIEVAKRILVDGLVKGNTGCREPKNRYGYEHGGLPPCRTLYIGQKKPICVGHVETYAEQHP